MKDKENIDGLPDLTEKQFAFVQHRAAGKSQVEAWRLAYDKKDLELVYAQQSAFKVASNPKVRQWLAALRLESVTLASITMDRWTELLMETIEDARQAGAWSAAVSGIKALQNAIGGERFAETQRLQDDRLLEDIERQFGREARERTAREMGYKDTTKLN